MRWAALLLVLGAGCPSFTGPDFGCATAEDCAAGEVCGARGVCCPPVSCDGRCGAQSSACGASASCEAPCTVHVAPGAAAGGDGSAERPLATIGEAIALAVPGARVELAEGDYGAGERFPLEVSKGIELVGAGSARTIIRGTSDVALRVVDRPLRATLLVGDETRANAIRDLTIAQDGPVDAAAIVCEAGPSRPPDEPLVAPNTAIERVLVRGAFHTGIVATGRGDARGACAMSIASSTVTGAQGFGLWVAGRCSLALWPTVRVERTRVADIGGATDVRGVLVWACTSSFRLERSRLERSFVGLQLSLSGETAPIPLAERAELRVLDNVVTEQEVGLWVVHGLRVSELRRNVFRGNTAAHGLARAIELTTSNQRMQDRFPSIALARQNVLEGNDSGLVVTGTRAADRSSDFGRPGDPGGNVFRCNSSTAGGGDLRLLVASSTTFLARGNTWDHVPPHSSTVASAGLDVLATADASLDVESAIEDSTPCPSGRVPGD